MSAIRNRFFKRFVLAFLVLTVIILAAFLAPKHVIRYFIWNYADIKDHEKFENLPVNNAENPAHFPVADNMVTLEVPDYYLEDERFNSFTDFLERKSSIAFLVVQNDTIIFESYFIFLH